MKNNIYERAKKGKAIFETSCVSTSQTQWDNLMKGATKANKKQVVAVALNCGIIDAQEAKKEIKNSWYNPYRQLKTKTHLIYVHSGIEHFILVN